MAELSEIIQDIHDNIHTNGQNQITGQLLQTTLDGMAVGLSEQVSQLGQKVPQIDSLKFYDENSDVILGKRINTSNSFVDDPLFFVTGYIPVTGGDTIIWNCAYPTANVARLLQYNSSKEYIDSSNNSVTPKQITLNSNAAYVRATFSVTNAELTYLAKDGVNFFSYLFLTPVIKQALSALTIIGDLSGLSTQEKTTVVGAINETVSRLQTCEGYFNALQVSDVQDIKTKTWTSGQAVSQSGTVVSKGGDSWCEVELQAGTYVRGYIYMGDTDIAIFAKKLQNNTYQTIVSANNSSPYWVTFNYFVKETGVYAFSSSTYYLQYATIITCKAGFSTALNGAEGNKMFTRIRVAEFNEGRYGFGAQTGMPDNDNAPSYIDAWKKCIVALNADIILCCEHSENFKKGISSAEYKTYQNMFSHFFPYKYGTNEETYIFSKFRLYSGEKKYSTDSGREYKTALCEINGKEVRLVAYHPIAGQSSASVPASYPGSAQTCGESRTLDNTELAQEFNDKYIIIGSDTNCKDISELAPFTSAGFVFANWGYWGQISTVSGTSECADNIIVKGFDIDSFAVYRQAYKCVTANSDATFTAEKWEAVQNVDKLGVQQISDWVANTNYSVGDYVLAPYTATSDHLPVSSDINMLD